MVEADAEQLVCVTGAGGFIGSWLVKELLQRGYAVRGTARDPGESARTLLAIQYYHAYWCVSIRSSKLFILSISCYGACMPEDSKNSHLLALDGAQERLSLYHADVLDYMSLRRAFSLCDGVFHVASPISNDPVSSSLLPPVYALLGFLLFP